MGSTRSNPVIFGPFSLITVGGQDIFVVALITADGSVRWATTYGGPGNDFGVSLIVDPSGRNLFVTGTFERTANFGVYGVTSFGLRDIFLVRIDTVLADVVYVQGFGGNNFDQAWDIAYDTVSSSIFIVGNTASTSVSFGGITIINTPEGSYDFLLVKVADTGVVTFARSFPNTGFGDAHSVTVDSFGAVYITGTFSNEINLGGTIFVANGQDVLSLKVTNDGSTVLWATSFGSQRTDIGVALAVDPLGARTFLTGTYSGDMIVGTIPVPGFLNEDIFIVILDATTGGVISAEGYGSTGTGNDTKVDVVNSLAYDTSTDTFVVTGRYPTTIEFGPFTLNTILEQVFLLKHRG